MHPLYAINRHRPTVVLGALIGLTIGLGAAGLRSDEYRSEAVIGVQADTIGRPAASDDASRLAKLYADVAISDTIERRVARMTRLPQGEIENALSATVLDSAPGFRISAESARAATATRIAGTAVAQTNAYIRGLTRGVDPRPVLARYRRLSQQLSDVQFSISRERTRLELANRPLRSTGLARLNSTYRGLLLRLQATAQTFAASGQAAVDAPRLFVPRSVEPARSLRVTHAPRFMVAGAIGGLVVAALFTLVLEESRLRPPRIPRRDAAGPAGSPT